MWVDSTLQLLKMIVTVLTFVLQKQVGVFNLTDEEYVLSAVASAMSLASSLLHDDVAARRCGLSILPECRGILIVFQLSHAKSMFKCFFSK